MDLFVKEPATLPEPSRGVKLRIQGRIAGIRWCSEPTLAHFSTKANARRGNRMDAQFRFIM
jgi:hypothetical protein